MGVYGTRSTFSPRLTDFAFPSTFSPSFTCFHSSGRAGRWRDTFRRTSSRLTVFVFPSTFSPSFTCFHSSGRGWDTFRPTSSRLTVFAYPSMFSPSFQLCAPCPDALAGDRTRSTFSPRLTVYVFPSTFSSSFTSFPSSKVLGVDRTRSVELRHGSTFSHLLTDNHLLTLPSNVKPVFSLFPQLPTYVRAHVPTFRRPFPDDLAVRTTVPRRLARFGR